MQFFFQVEVGSIRVNTDEIYRPMIHKPLSLFGRGYTFRYRLLNIKLCLVAAFMLTKKKNIEFNCHKTFDSLSS